MVANRLTLLVVFLASCRIGSHLDLPACDEACQALAATNGCVSTQSYFRDYAWPKVFSDCVQCHTPMGEADGTRFILEDESAPDYLTRNQQVVSEIAQLTDSGQPLIVLKPTQTIPHQGGRRIAPGSEKLAVLESMLTQLQAPVTCPDDVPAPSPVTEGLVLLDGYGTLRKAAFQLVGRLPTNAEIAAVDAGGVDALGPLLDAMMQEPDFYERVREIFGDVLLTDAFRVSNANDNQTNIISTEYVFPHDVVDGPLHGIPEYEYDEDPEGIRVIEALAREPLEFVVRAVRNDLPMSEILTAKYRLTNAHSAGFFGVAHSGDPEAFQPTQLPMINERSGGPGEYAGILTTTAFIRRYPSTPTNFNRKRARFTYKYFLNYDIMKLAPRLDASTVDLTAYPTRNNMQCTGCHSQIDPLAGAFMNWTECGYEQQAIYFPASYDKYDQCSDNGWVSSDHMFPPGTAAGEANVIAPADRPKALEHLAAAIVTKPGFADAITQHTFTALMGRAPLNKPGDPTLAGFANLNLAYNAEHDELVRLSKVFTDAGLHYRPLVKALILSPFFRAASADRDNRLELLAVGGGTQSTPEALNRRVKALFGDSWRQIKPANTYDGLGKDFLTHRNDLRTLYGGIDGTFDGVKQRQRLPNSLSAAVSERLALDMSCRFTARDFDKPAAQRRLFPFVDKDVVPSGDPSAADQAGIIKNIQYLHERIAGERLAADDPEILATYSLLSNVRADGLAKHVDAALERPCSADYDLNTLAVTNGTKTDPTYVVRAWQAVLTYLIMDYGFLFER